MSELRGAIIGYGLAGSVFHGPLIESTPGLAVAVVATGDPERADRARHAHPGAEVVATPEEALARAAELDFAVVATANERHVPLAGHALDAGLPAVVEKPLAPSAAEARPLVERAGELGLPLTVFMNRRWDSDQLTLRSLLAADRLGRVLRHESRFERWRPRLAPGEVWRESSPPKAGGGVLLDLGSHLVDQALGLLGPVRQVYAEIDHRRAGPADDDAFLALHHESGALSHLWCSSLAAVPGPRLRVLGDRAGFVVTDVDGQEQALRSGERPGPGAGWGMEPRERWGKLVDEDGSEAIESRPGAWPEFYAGWELTLREGNPPPVDPSEAVAGLEILDAARRSASDGSVVSLAR